MDSSAINLIQKTAIDAVSSYIPESLQGKAAALPVDHKIINLEPYSHGRFRFRGSLLTQSIADFVQYIKATGKGEGFIDADSLSANVFFNLGTEDNPGHADWLATLKIKATAAYKALIAIDGKPLTQKQLIDWLEDWSSYLAPIGQEGSEPQSLTAAIAAIRKVKIKATSESETTQGDFKASRSKFDEIEAKSSLGMPSGFDYVIEPYLGLPVRTFVLRLSVLTDDEKPRLILRIVRREAQEESMAQDFKTVLFTELESTATLTIGTFTP